VESVVLFFLFIRDTGGQWFIRDTGGQSDTAWNRDIIEVFLQGGRQWEWCGKKEQCCCWSFKFSFRVIPWPGSLCEWRTGFSALAGSPACSLLQLLQALALVLDYISASCSPGASFKNRLALSGAMPHPCAPTSAHLSRRKAATICAG
jgi:hypothetical protein